MKYIFCSVVAAFLTVTEVHCQCFTEVVPTDKGAVQGKILETVLNSRPYSAFTNIPFAKPPVGDLRFRVSPISFCLVDVIIELNSNFVSLKKDI